MQRESIAGLCLYYAPEEQEAARIIGSACERTVALLQQRWGLSPPADCRVYVMTSWSSFLFSSATCPWKAYLALTFPLVAHRAKGIWPYAGGWSLQFDASADTITLPVARRNVPARSASPDSSVCARKSRATSRMIQAAALRGRLTIMSGKSGTTLIIDAPHSQEEALP